MGSSIVNMQHAHRTAIGFLPAHLNTRLRSDLANCFINSKLDAYVSCLHTIYVSRTHTNNGTHENDEKRIGVSSAAGS